MVNFLLLLLTFCSFLNISEASSLQDDCLHAHNVLRQLHQATGNVGWDAALANQAQVWADYLSNIGSLAHASASERSNAGENLYYSRKRRVAKCADATLAWYSEEETNYNYITGTSRNGKAIGHFTQVVWKSTVKIGAGIASSSLVIDGKVYYDTYIVVRYSPAGNVKNQFIENVQQQKPGVQVPTLTQIDPSICYDIDPAAMCTYLKNSASYGPCTNSAWKGYFEDNCKVSCGFC